MDGLYDQFRIALHQVWRRRWLALAVAWAVCLVGWLVLALIPNSYESHARVYYQAQALIPSAAPDPSGGQGDVFRVRQALTSSANLEKVVRRTDLNSQVASDADLAAQVSDLRDAIKVMPALDNPNLFTISATASVAGFSNEQNARVAYGVVQTLLDLLASDGLSGDTAATGKTLDVLDQELKNLEGRLQEAEQRRSQFEQRFLGVLPGGGSIADRLSAARAEIANLDQELTIAQGSLAALRGQMAALPSSIVTVGGPDGGGAAGQIAALQGQLSQAYSRGWTDNHPDVIAIKSQIERLRPEARTERRGGGGTSTANPAYASLAAMAAEKQAQVSAAGTRKAQLEASMAQLQSTETSEPDVIAQQAQLNRDYDVLKRQYDSLLQDREQVRLRGDVSTKTDALQFRVIDTASRPTVPASPNRPLLLSAILVLGIAAGVGAAFVKGQLQPTFPTQARLEQVTGLPVLGSISEALTASEGQLRRQRLKYFGGAGAALAAGYAVLMLVEFWQRSTVA